MVSRLPVREAHASRVVMSMTGASPDLLDLVPAVLPARSDLRRAAVLRPEARGPDHDERYDSRTLVYGAAYRPDRRALVLVGPPPLNLDGLIRAGGFLADGTRLKLRRIRTYRRHCEIWLDAAAAPADLRFRHDELDLAVPILRPLPGFAGRRCLVTLSRDNDLDWIANWARHCARHQGAEALLFLDNGSTRYSPAEIAARLADVAGLSAATVCAVPSPFGPLGTRSPVNRALFLQTALLNLCRHAWLRDARTVLHCDIDEMPVSDGPTLFEAAESSWLGYATAGCPVRFAAPGGAAAPRHGDHVLRREPETFTKEKWALRVRGPLGDTVWSTHGVAGYAFNRLARARGIRFYHCQGISTNWKGNRATMPVAELVEDPRTREDFRRLGVPTGRAGQSDHRGEAGRQAGPR